MNLTSIEICCQRREGLKLFILKNRENKYFDLKIIKEIKL